MRRFSIAALVVATLLAVDVSPVLGQVFPSIRPGSRVRITAPSLGLNEAVGTVQEATDEALVIEIEFPRRVVPVERSEIEAMDVLIGRERGGLSGLGKGALIGGSAGLLLGFMSGDDDPSLFFSFSAEEKAAIGAVLIGATGGIIGLLLRRDIWSPALPGEIDLTVLPLVREGGAGLHVGLALRF